MNKKINALIIVVIILCLQLPLGVSASSTESLGNGSFETLSGSVPSKWSFSGGTFGTEFNLDSTDPYSGNYALKISGAGSMYAAQNFTLKSNTKYVLDGWLKISSLSAGGSAGFKFQYKDSTGNYLEDPQTITYTNLNNGKWQYIKYEFTTPVNTANADLLLRLLNGGTISWDFLSIRNVELVAGGDFESFSSWNTSVWPTKISNVPGYEGNAILISNTDNTLNPYAAQSVTGIIGGAEYLISGYYKGTVTKGDGGGIKLESYDSAGKGLKDKTHTLGAALSWTYFEFTFTPPVGTTKFTFYVRLYGSGTAYFDNLSMKRTDSNIRKMSIVPETLFYYTENTTGEISVDIGTSYHQIPSGAKILLNILDESKVLKTYTFNNVTEKNSLSFETKQLAVEGKGYTVTAEYTTSGGTVIESSQETIYRYKRPTHINSKGEFIDHDNSVIVPVIAYHFPYTDFAKAKEAGINVVQCAYTSASLTKIEETFAAAEKYGLKVLIPLYANMKPAGHPDNVNRTIACIEKFKNHPSLYGWMVMDEPQPNSDQMYEYLKASYKLIRDLDPNHPVYICECTKSSFVQSGQCSDVLAIDPYPAFLSAMPNRVFEYTQAAKEAVKYKKPVYVVVQAWDWQGWEPSSNDLRHMFYQALLADADGLGFYPINDASSTIWNIELWNGTKGFAEYEMTPAFDAFIHGKYTLTKNTSNESFHYAVYKGTTETYVVAINRTATAQTAIIPVTATGNIVDVNGGNSSNVTYSSGVLTVPLEAYGAVCYKFTTDNLASASFWRNNNRLYTLADGDVEIRTRNTSNKNVITSLYEVEGTALKLVKVSTSSTVSLGNLDANKKYVLKAFVWDSFSKIKPYSEVVYID